MAVEVLCRTCKRVIQGFVHSVPLHQASQQYGVPTFPCLRTHMILIFSSFCMKTALPYMLCGLSATKVIPAIFGYDGDNAPSCTVLIVWMPQCSQKSQLNPPNRIDCVWQILRVVLI